MAVGGMTVHRPGYHAVNLLPGCLGLAGVIVFIVIAGTHLRHMARTSGQRRPWHACHVLMAVGMAFMYAPAWLDPSAVPAGFWRLVLATAGVIVAVWALGGSGAKVNLIWLLTAMDLGAMFYMFSGPSQGRLISWIVLLYLLADAGLWVFDAYRRVDTGESMLSELSLDAGSGARTVSLRVGAGANQLLGDLDISPSMAVMAVGMAYMIIAMQIV